MSIDYINKNPELLKTWIEKEKKNAEEYARANPDSLVPLFERELRDMGFQFEISNQILHYLPKHKKEIMPIAIKYYQQAKQLEKYDEQNHFLTYLGYRGFDEVVPMLIEDYHSPTTSELLRWSIADSLYSIRSKHYVDEYMDIISNTSYGRNRQMLILLVGKLKVEKAIPILVELLQQEEVRLHAISALGDFQREELREYFEMYKDSKHSGWRKYARAALKKLEKYNDNPI